jgi:hypothetical protein
MAVSHRTWLGGSLRPLSPTEGKFRVKGNCFLVAAGGAISVADGTKIDQGGAFRAVATPSSSSAVFFAWQNDYDYGQYILTKPCPSGKIGRMIDPPKGKADIQGTAPQDDPV